MKTTSTLCFILVAAYFCMFARAQVNKQPYRTEPAIPAWMTTDWTGDENPYKDVEASLKKEIAQKEDMDLVAKRYASDARKHSKDPLAQFAWVCSTRAAIKIAHPLDAAPEALLDAMERTDPKNVHEYTLMRFLITQETRPSTPHLYVVAERLVHNDPNDEYIKPAAIYALSWAGKYAQSLPLAKDWVKLKPGNATAHTMLAEVYYDKWQAGGRKSVSLGNQVIAEYRTYLKLASPTDPFRRPAQLFIERVMKERNNQQ